MRQWQADSAQLDQYPRLIINISASPFCEESRPFASACCPQLPGATKPLCFWSTRWCGNDGLVFDGSSLLLDPSGTVVARGACFAEDLVVVDFPRTAEVSPAPCNETAEVWQALVLGTRDYVRKCGFSKVLIGLSGGIDSALVAAIAVEALGAENVVGIGMPSEYSSLGSIEDARSLAKNLGIRFELLPIHDVFAQFQKVLQPLFAGTPSGIAEENIQSRTRGVFLMALSNKFGALVLTTGNKSEMSVGYCTLYGDMVGALAVIGDVYKTRVYQLSHYANRTREIIPRNTIEKPPSAELRPDQRDTDLTPALRSPSTPSSRLMWRAFSLPSRLRSSRRSIWLWCVPSSSSSNRVSTSVSRPLPSSRSPGNPSAPGAGFPSPSKFRFNEEGFQ